jgi:hypothetical protein
MKVPSWIRKCADVVLSKLPSSGEALILTNVAPVTLSGCEDLKEPTVGTPGVKNTGLAALAG